MKRGDLSSAERETVMLTNDEDNFYTITTIQQKMMTKMKKAEIEPYKTELDEDGKIFCLFYKVPYRQISIRKATKPSTTVRKPNPNAFGRGTKVEEEIDEDEE